MPRLIQVLLALSLLLNTFVLAGFVYRSWIAPPAVRAARCRRHRRRRRTRPSPLETLAQ